MHNSGPWKLFSSDKIVSLSLQHLKNLFTALLTKKSVYKAFTLTHTKKLILNIKLHLHVLQVYLGDEHLFCPVN